METYRDAERLEIVDGDPIQLTTRRGTIRLPARVEQGGRPGTVFVPFHWGDLYGEGNALNYLTVPAFGPVEKQPELKFCAVQVQKVKAEPEPAAAQTTRRSLELLDVVQQAGPR